METNTLISSIGRRAELLNCFRASTAGLGTEGRVLGIDCSRWTPAFHLADGAWVVPRCLDKEFVPTVLEICTRERVRLLVPTIDTELAVYSANRPAFADIGTAVAVSSPETVLISSDKVETNRWLIAKGFPTVRQATPQSVLDSLRDWTFPLLVKPRSGSASVGVRPVGTPEALSVAAQERDDLVVEEIAQGQECTVNLFVAATGHCVCAVPHKRLEVRSGEVSKAVTFKNRKLMELAKAIAEALPGAFGALNIQCFVADDGSIRVFEINPRFGGGYPVAHRAGAHFTKWLLEEVTTAISTASFDEWTDNLVMLRYDSSVFLNPRDLEAKHI